VFVSPEDPALVFSYRFGGTAIFIGANVVVRGLFETSAGEHTAALCVFDGETEVLLHRFLPAALAYDSELAARGSDILVATGRTRTVTLLDGDTGAVHRSFEDPEADRGRMFGSAIASSVGTR